MKTLVLPGFSFKNLDWAEDVRDKVDGDVEVFYWPHWETKQIQSNWKDMVVDEIVKRFEGQKINVIAKSVGTIVAMLLLKRNPNLFEKLILCGIPMSDFQESDKELFENLADFQTENLLIIQNDKDPLAAFTRVEEMIHAIKPEIKIISKPASTHDYPYFDEFKEFLD